MTSVGTENSWKWLKSTVFAVSIIQLPSRKGVWYEFNVPNCYLKTKMLSNYEDLVYFTTRVPDTSDTSVTRVGHE